MCVWSAMDERDKKEGNVHGKNSICYLFKTVEWHDNSYNFQLGKYGYCADQQKQKNNMKALNHRTHLKIHMKMNMDTIILFFLFGQVL